MKPLLVFLLIAPLWAKAQQPGCLLNDITVYNSAGVGTARLYVYDNAQNLVQVKGVYSVSVPEVMLEQYTYDAQGFRLTADRKEQFAPTRVVESYSYTNGLLSRSVSVATNVSAVTPTTPIQTVRLYAYDALDRPTSVTTASFSLTATFPSVVRVATYTDGILTASQQVNLTTGAVLNDDQVQNGRITRTGSATFYTTTTYDAAGNILQRETFGSGTVQTRDEWTYDTRENSLARLPPLKGWWPAFYENATPNNILTSRQQQFLNGSLTTTRISATTYTYGGNLPVSYTTTNTFPTSSTATTSTRYTVGYLMACPLLVLSEQSGTWNDPATWSCSCIPPPNASIIVQPGQTITIPAGYEARARSVLARGLIRYGPGGRIRLSP